MEPAMISLHKHFLAFLEDQDCLLNYATGLLPELTLPARGSWTVDEHLLHLGDSARVNLNRVLWALEQRHLEFQGYAQDLWVKARQGQFNRQQLIELLLADLHQLLALARSLPAAELFTNHARHNLHEIAWQPYQRDLPASLEDLLRDFFGHLRHHLQSLLGEAAPPVRLHSALLPVSLPMESERMFLSAFTEDDLDELAPMLADPEVMRFIPGPPRTREQAERGLKVMIAHQRRYGFAAFAVRDKANKQLQGWCGLMEFDATGEVELLYLFARSAWGRGLATEASRVVVEAARQIGLARLVAAVMPENKASRRVLEKCGFGSWRGGRHFGCELEMLKLEFDPHAA
jgi:RimJ/RimL family protein N-acetyltransferase